CQTNPPSFGIMEDHADGVTAAGTQAAHAMPEVDAIGAARAMHRAVMHGERNRVSLLERNHLGARLHARTLLGQHELATLEITAGLGQQDRDLQREDMLAIEVLMQAIVVTG